MCSFAGCERATQARGLCRTHYMQQWKGRALAPIRPRTIPTPDRFWAKVQKSYGCWTWTGAIGSHGYGNFGANGRFLRAHRFAYELLVGPIPSGLVLDHLCRNRACVNPDHLEPVTQRINTLRGDGPRLAKLKNVDQTECKSGHPLAGDNLYVQPKTGYRYCRTCQRARDAAYRARRTAAHIVH